MRGFVILLFLLFRLVIFYLFTRFNRFSIRRLTVYLIFAINLLFLFFGRFFGVIVILYFSGPMFETLHLLGLFNRDVVLDTSSMSYQQGIAAVLENTDTAMAQVPRRWASAAPPTVPE